jgi:2'-5' RNA ligase
MALLAVAYPHLSPTDYAWIQTLRQHHDPHPTLIAPHFTLVFPTSTLDQTLFIDHITAQAEHVHAIPLLIQCAMIVKDAFSPQTHLFLVPDQGYSHLVKLHDTLYSGILAQALRLDVPFIPHITVGAHTNPHVCKKAADQINHQAICIRGHIDQVDILTYENHSVSTVKQIGLR